ncbi:MAG: defective in fruiting DifE [Myxococcaceae bacterium]|nr:defective in fruiting DifE [Myxococcaceae bacterium]
MVAPERRLCVFFEAGRTRYALEATSVLEVARPQGDDETFRGHLGIRDLSELVGGGPEVRPGTVVVLDTSPTVAARTLRVDGVFDVSGHLALPLSSRLVPLLAPVVKQGLVSEAGLSFELDVAQLVRGLPRPQKRLEVATGEAKGPCLVFDSGARRFAVGLSDVSQVASRGVMFNPAPGVGSFLGVLMHQQRLVPAFSLTSDEAEALLVVVELASGPVAVSASRAHGVKSPDALGEATVIDVVATFG